MRSGVLRLLLDSVLKLLSAYSTSSDYTTLAPSLCDFVECLFDVDCSEYDILEEESILHRVLLLFQRFFQTDCWLCLYDTDIWNIIYSTHCLYSQVGSQRLVEDRPPIPRVCVT